ncbi:Lrp/AsnC family transcriptional regulator [Sedimenticola selenatireducens]|uniref:Lrp/AsnC family transcriptional regulator n=1 Tax=Sedimenticola selenatireducens TaxID=191960 RepID=A0A557S895_9GAMM|nr:Lrp/AsnC family transcriptional regulator [Sedimenticola selenatireducens]TVO73541.1 Lrp/AsnC family transcriptional regulator [Sedimenticola selenatireducens]TVT63482.1 MAG: Lrp/AsnC family transcriptional regulator [Sedimenticola selenatireducens]
MDRTDKKILNLLQQNCSLSTAEIAEQIGLSTTPCWRRIQNLEKCGVIQKRVALLDRKSINLGVDVFVAIKTRHHNAEWLDAFAEAVSAFSEVVEFYRMSGDIDYLMRVVVPDINAYDRFYKRLIEKVDIQDVSSSFAMEQIKYTTSLPVDYA